MASLRLPLTVVCYTCMRPSQFCACTQPLSQTPASRGGTGISTTDAGEDTMKFSRVRSAAPIRSAPIRCPQ